jgi:hypothetical protein
MYSSFTITLNYLLSVRDSALIPPSQDGKAGREAERKRGIQCVIFPSLPASALSPSLPVSLSPSLLSSLFPSLASSLLLPPSISSYPCPQMLDWEQDLLQRELRLAEREARLRNISAAPVNPTDPVPAAFPDTLHLGGTAAALTAPGAIDADRGSGDGGGNAGGGGGEATLDMPAVIEVFEAERQALIQAFSGCALPSTLTPPLLAGKKCAKQSKMPKTHSFDAQNTFKLRLGLRVLGMPS